MDQKKENLTTSPNISKLKGGREELRGLLEENLKHKHISGRNRPRPECHIQTTERCELSKSRAATPFI